MDERKVAVKNNTRGPFYYAIPNRHIKREVPANGVLRVPFDELQEGLYNKGILQAFKEGKLTVVDHQDAVDLELVPFTPKLTMDEQEILAVLTGEDNGKKFVMMRDASPAMKDLIISLIIENRLSDKVIVDYAKQLYKYDVLKAITNVS